MDGQNDMIDNHVEQTPAGTYVLNPPTLAQKQSVPACTSFDCATDTMDPHSRVWEAPVSNDYYNPHSLNMTHNDDAVAGYSHFRKEQEGLLSFSQVPVETQ